MKKSLYILTFIILSLTLLMKESYSIPAFSRKYKTSCSTCHYVFPKLNAFGKAFKNNGYRYPVDDKGFVKEEPVSLGSEGYKKVWPDAIWPADIPGTSPLSVLAIGRINYEALSDVKWGFEIPHEVEVLYAGTIGENFSFFGEIEMENEDNEIEFAFPFALQYDLDPGFHIRAGMVHSDPTPEHLRLTRNHFNVASLRSRNGWRFRDHQYGLELLGAFSGIGNRGGLTYRFGVVNGKGLTALKPQKDFYGKVTYKIGGLSEIGGTKGVKKSQSSEFYIDNSLRLGGFFYAGTQTEEGAKDENLAVFGGDLDFWYDRFIVNSTVMFMNSDLVDTTDERKSLAYYVQGNSVIYPWLIGIVRYEWEDRDIDNDNIEPVNAIIPGITVVARANIKLMFEFKKYLDEANKKNDSFTLQINFGI